MSDRYRIKGGGDVREVFDGARLVGAIKRKSREEFKWRITPTNATCRKVIEVWWTATHANGTPVRWRDGQRMCRAHMKDWTDPINWTGSHVEPLEATDV